jgi:[protein-PII] uridylyltransferase
MSDRAMDTPIDLTLFEQPNVISTFKQLLKVNQTQLREKFNPKESVAILLRERSDFLDNILNVCWQHFLGEFSHIFALCAVGGYGRHEMFPYSDVDILILTPDEKIEASQNKLSEFFTFLWDIGFKLGYSVRSVEQCVDVAANDQTIMTSLLEIRLIMGCSRLLQSLKEEIAPDKIWSSDQFLPQKWLNNKPAMQNFMTLHRT